jgi:hypothetical protein
MKKILVVLVLGFFVACNGSGSSQTTDSTTIVKTDTVTTGSDSSKAMMDSTKKMMDSTKKMVDSAKK